MSKPIKRSQVDRPLTCAEYDSNLDATLDRANHTGTQSATTIYDLYETVDDYDFIQALKKCCQDLKDQLDQLRKDIFGEGELLKLIDRLREELLELINDLALDVDQLKTDVAILKVQVNNLNLAIQNIYQILDKVVYFGGSSTVDYNLATGTDTFNEGVYYFRNFTIGPSATLTVSPAAKVFCSGRVNINGNIVVTQIPGTGGAPVGFLEAAGDTRTNTVGKGFGAGDRTAGGPSYAYYLQSGGSGGASGTAIGTGATGQVSGGGTSQGGNGGGYFIIDCAGMVTITGTITAKGGNASPGGAVAAHVEASGLVYTLPAIAGAGGGSGGLIWIRSLTSISYLGIADVRGGNGSDAVGADTSGMGGGTQAGGGGGGGYVVLNAPTVETTGITLHLEGGIPGVPIGVNDVTVHAGGGGGYGGAGGNTSTLTNGVRNVAAGTGGTGKVVIRNIRPAA